MYITFNSSTRIFNSAKATKIRSGCWRTAVVEFYVDCITALFFALAKTRMANITNVICVECSAIMIEIAKFALAKTRMANVRSVFRVKGCSTIKIGIANIRIRMSRSIRCSSAFRNVGRSSSIRSFRRSFSKIWCCNLEARVLRCQRRPRGFDSPQHRHGIGRSIVGPWLVRPMTRVRFPSHPPNLGVAQQ